MKKEFSTFEIHMRVIKLFETRSEIYQDLLEKGFSSSWALWLNFLFLSRYFIFIVKLDLHCKRAKAKSAGQKSRVKKSKKPNLL